jgi:hypothetical protein
VAANETMKILNMKTHLLWQLRNENGDHLRNAHEKKPVIIRPNKKPTQKP